MKQLGLAFLQYVQDYDDVPPSGTNAANGWQMDSIGWITQEWPYIKTIKVLQCPNDNYVMGAPATNVATSYAENSMAMIGDITKNNNFGVRVMGSMSKWSAPSITVLMFEKEDKKGSGSEADPAAAGSQAGDASCACYEVQAYWAGHGLETGGGNIFGTGQIGGWPRNATAVHADAMLMQTTQSPRHNNGSNYLAADGHVKFLPPQLVSSGWDAKDQSQPQDTNCVSGATDCAAGTAKMTLKDGVSPVTLTFSKT